MRFTFAAALAALAMGVAATEDYTVTVTDYTTFCPKASATPEITVSAGTSYSVSHPLITSTVTHCNKCSSTPTPIPSSVAAVKPSSSPVAHWAASSSVAVSPSSIAISSTPLPRPSGSAARPSGWNAGPSGSANPSGPSGSSPSAPVFTGGANRAAAGAGAGLATVFGLAAFLL